MAMRLFLSNETDFSSNGHKYIESIFTHEIRNNSEWYLDVRVPLEFIEFIEHDNIVVVKTKEKGKQPFRIKDITVGYDIRFEAWHIGFDTKVYTVSLSTIINLNCQNAINEILGDTQSNNFTSFSDISGLQTFSIINMTLYEALIDIASRYNGVLEFDGWQIRIVSSIGSDKGVTIAYGKNLESAEVEERWDMVCTELLPLGNDGLVGSTVFSSIQYDRPYAKIVSFDTDDLTTLNNLASAYVSRFESPQMYYKVSANVDGGLGDTIQVKARQFTVFTQVLGYKFNIKTQQMIEIEFGNFRPTVKNAIGQLREEIVQVADRKAQLKIDEATGVIEAYADNQIMLAVGTAVNGQDSILPYDVNQWEQGGYSGADGLPLTTTADIRTKTTIFTPILPSTDYIITCSSSLSYPNTGILLYTEFNEFISYLEITGGERKITTPSNARYVRARATKSDLSTFTVNEMPNHFVRVTQVGKFLKGSKFEIDGEKIISQADGIEFRNSGGTPVVFFDTVNNRFVFRGQVEANTGLIGRFAISGQDLVYTSELFDKDYDRSDLTKLHRILLGFEPTTPYDLAVYDFNNSGTLNISDLSILDSFIQGISPLPTPRKRIRSVVRIGTNNGAFTTQSVAENGSVGPTTTIRGEKVSSDLINANLIGAKGSNISQMSADGLSFSGVGSTNNRTLDDYEEGTFTPVLSGLTTAGLGTYSVQEGRYTKVGNKVTFGIRLIWTTHTGTGGMIISLPFTSTPGTFNPCTIVASTLTFTGQLSAMIGGNENRVVIYQFSSGGALTVVNMDTNAALYINGTYMV